MHTFLLRDQFDKFDTPGDSAVGKPDLVSHTCSGTPCEKAYASV
jgi:hypothetical protein